MGARGHGLEIVNTENRKRSSADARLESLGKGPLVETNNEGTPLRLDWREEGVIVVED
jgi:hypothetical protein